MWDMLKRAKTVVKVGQVERTGAAILFDRVTRRFSAVTAVADLTLTVERGEFITFLGPSGSGKTTCLMLLAGFETPDVGELYIDRVPISRMPPHRRDIGVVFQSYALFPHMTVAENIGFPLRQRGVGRQQLHSRVTETLELVQMAGLGGRYPRQLSGGQQQRVAIARAVIFRPRVLLMDEPLSALDKKLREDMQFEIKELHRRLGITFVYVTHDQHEALVMSDRIAVMRQGRIEQLGTPGDVYDRPANRFVASFIGESNFLDGDIRYESGWAVLDRAGAVIRGVGTQAGSSLMVRPEKIGVGVERGVAGASNIVSAIVQDVAFAGDIRRYVLRLADGTTITAKEQHRSGIPDYEPGAAVQLTWAVADTLVV
jgi:putative spermidine/putrescine transport system ATP-binding protein